MDRREIEEKVVAALGKKLGLEVAQINIAAKLVDDLGMDSFTAVELMFDLEEQCGIDIPDHDMAQIKTVDQLIEYIDTKINKAVLSFSGEKDTLGKNEAIIFKSSSGDSFNIKIIEDFCSQPAQIKDQLINDIRMITKKAWADPRDLAEKWFKVSNILVLAYDQNSICGFALGSYVDDEVLFLPATMTTSIAQFRGLAVFLNNAIIKSFFLHIISSGKRDSSKANEPIYVVFWTPSPLMYSIVAKHMELFPSPTRSVPTDKEREAVAKAIKKYSCFMPVNFDDKRFVDIGCDLNYPELVYDRDKIPWARDKKINDFFENNLELTKKTGNNFVVVGKGTLRDLLFDRV